MFLDISVGCIIRQSKSSKTMKIVIDKDVVGKLTDDGEIITSDIWLQKLADRIRRQKLIDLRSRKTGHGHYGYLVTVQKGKPRYISAVVEILLDNGYGLE